jgi:hypothetical protein
MARYDSEGFYVLEHAPRVAWAHSNYSLALRAPLPADAGRSNNYSLALSALLPADSGTWLCTLNSRTQYLHATALLIRGLCAGIFKQSLRGAKAPSKNRVVITGPPGNTQPGGIGSLESILGLLKSLKIRAQYISAVAEF